MSIGKKNKKLKKCDEKTKQGVGQHEEWGWVGL